MKIALVFTFNVSVRIWHARGFLSRERAIYEKLMSAGGVDEIYWFTYGIDDAGYQHYLPSTIKIIPAPRFCRNPLGKIIYSFLMPVIQRHWFRQCDLIKTNQVKGAWTALIVKLFLRKKIIVRAGYLWSRVAVQSKYAGSLDRFSHLVEKVCFQKADCVMVTALSHKQYIMKHYLVSEEKIKVIPNCIDTEIFKPIPGIEKFRDRIIYVGRISSEKNIPMVIETLSGTDYELDIYGEGDKNQQDSLADLADKLKVKVRFQGTVDNAFLPETLNKYRVFVLYSEYEGMPKALLEAMACGLVCVGTRVEGILDIIRDNETGILVEKGNITQLTATLHKIFTDNNFTESLSRNAVEYIKQNFTTEKIAQEEDTVIRSFLY
ncbi:MAG: glycosyltransferase family 4 protein [Candidatus Omnitrophica bacterium]|nr:glycosyltransferase family 4 protein [Candidatus Omnitrophota bacterium]